MLSPAAADLLLWVVAGLVALWILLPAVMFKLAPVRLRNAVDDDPLLAEPPPGAPDYQRRFQQFAALGFRPLGRTFETCWFMSPIKPYWRSLQGVCWLTSEDGLTFVSFHRLIADEPVRFGAASYFAGGGMLRTTCPGVTGRVRADEEAREWRTELRDVDPEQLLRRHQKDLLGICLRRKLAPKSMTLAEIGAAEVAQGRRALGRGGGWAYKFIFVYFVAPALLTFALANRHSSLHHPAAAICVGASVFAVMRLIVLPLKRHRRALSAHATRS
jgi:hypothetical protein